MNIATFINKNTIISFTSILYTIHSIYIIKLMFLTVVKYILYIADNIKELVTFILDKIYKCVILNFNNKWFILFFYIDLPQNYVMYDDAYERHTLYRDFHKKHDERYYYFNSILQYNIFNIIHSWFIKHDENYNYNINKFNITSALLIVDYNKPSIKYIKLTYIIHFIYLFKSKLTLDDIKYISCTYGTNVDRLYITFSYNGKHYIKIINMKTNKYEDDTIIKYDNVFNYKKDDDQINCCNLKYYISKIESLFKN